MLDKWIYRQKDSLIVSLMERQIDSRKIIRNEDRQMDRWIDKWRSEQMERYICKERWMNRLIRYYTDRETDGWIMIYQQKLLVKFINLFLEFITRKERLELVKPARLDLQAGQPQIWPICGQPHYLKTTARKYIFI